jgi:DNA-binding transcriptional ArsR family regulator
LSEIGYSKRNIAMVLEKLTMGGLLTSVSESNRVRYRLADRQALARVLAPLPERSGQWHLRLPIVAKFLELASRIGRKDSITQGVEAQKLVTKLHADLVAVGALPNLPHAAVATYWPALQTWLAEHLLAEHRDSRRDVPRTIEGFWLGPGETVARAANPDGAVLPRLSTDADADELRCLDLVQVSTISPANDWTWGVLSRAATGSYQHSIGLDRGEHWRFVALGSGDVYEVSYDDAVPHERISRLYGPDAAARARADMPAVQLRLRRKRI